MNLTINVQPGGSIVINGNNPELNPEVQQEPQPSESWTYETPTKIEDLKNCFDIPSQKYFETEGLSSHKLIDFIKCPLLCVDKYDPVRAEHFITGRAAHTLILEGAGKFNEQYIVGGPVNPKTGKHYGRDTQAFEKWINDPENNAEGKEFITEEQRAECTTMNSSVYNHAEAEKILSSESVAELSVIGEMFDMKVKGRIDLYSEEYGLVDLKTVDDIDRMKYHFKDYMYDVQLAFYHWLITDVCEAKYCPVYLITVEKKHPYRTGVFYLHPDRLAAHRVRVMEAIQRYSVAKINNHWPTGYEEVRTI